MIDPWVCIDCGARQAEPGKCQACGHEDTLDARDEKVREFMRKVDQRLTEQREGRAKFAGIAIGMISVFGLWLVPGYWSLRGVLYPGLPVLLDQWMLMGLIGFAAAKLLGKVFGKPRFPYLDQDLTIQ